MFIYIYVNCLFTMFIYICKLFVLRYRLYICPPGFTVAQSSWLVHLNSVLQNCRGSGGTQAIKGGVDEGFRVGLIGGGGEEMGLRNTGRWSRMGKIFDRNSFKMNFAMFAKRKYFSLSFLVALNILHVQSTPMLISKLIVSTFFMIVHIFKQFKVFHI